MSWSDINAIISNSGIKITSMKLILVLNKSYAMTLGILNRFIPLTKIIMLNN